MITDQPHAKRGDIQGLRAVAVLGVLLYHTQHSVLSGGFVGVDVFFVISGYLISGILKRSLEAGTFSIRAFYTRRILRLYPALYTLLAVVVIAGVFLLSPGALKELSETAIATVFFISNIEFIRLSGYFEGSADLKPLLHTWSLGVEEQFYVVFPLLLLTLWTFFRQYIWQAICLCLILSLIVSVWLTGAYPTVAFYSPVTRVFELLVGVLSMELGRSAIISNAIKSIISLLGVGVIVLSMVVINNEMAFPGWISLMPCLGAAMVLISGRGPGAKLLSFAPLVYIGDCSYSLYLWHWPLIVFMRIVTDYAPWAAWVAAGLSLPIAAASLHFIEKPFLRSDAPPFALWPATVAVMAASVGALALIMVAHGFPQRVPQTVKTVLLADNDFNPRRPQCHFNTKAALSFGSDKRFVLPYESTCQYGATSRPSVVIYGDSHGAELAESLGKILNTQGESVRQITSALCPPAVNVTIIARPGCQATNAEMLAHIKADTVVKDVVLIANYEVYNSAIRPAIVKGVEETALDLISGGKHVVIVYPVPTGFPFDPAEQAAFDVMYKRDPRKLGLSVADYMRKAGPVRTELGRFASANHIDTADPYPLFCDTVCHVADKSGHVLYFNDNHLGVAGTDILAAEVVKTLL